MEDFLIEAVLTPRRDHAVWFPSPRLIEMGKADRENQLIIYLCLVPYFAWPGGGFALLGWIHSGGPTFPGIFPVMEECATRGQS